PPFRVLLAGGGRALRPRVDDLDGHPLRLLRAPALEELEHDVLARHPRLELASEDDPSRRGDGRVDVTRGPSGTGRRRADADADRAVRPVGAAVRVSAGNELPR